MACTASGGSRGVGGLPDALPQGLLRAEADLSILETLARVGDKAAALPRRRLSWRAIRIASVATRWPSWLRECAGHREGDWGDATRPAAASTSWLLVITGLSCTYHIGLPWVGWGCRGEFR